MNFCEAYKKAKELGTRCSLKVKNGGRVMVTPDDLKYSIVMNNEEILSEGWQVDYPKNIGPFTLTDIKKAKHKACQDYPLTGQDVIDKFLYYLTGDI